jgi:signal recognition particle subunit SRP54
MPVLAYFCAMFDNLQERLERSFKNLKGQGSITELNIATTVKEIRRALVDADVNYKIAKEFTDRVKDQALGQQVLTSVSPGQLMVKIVADELTALMGGIASEVNIKGSPAVVLIAGLQGSGKTTFSAKFAHWVKSKNGRQPLLVAADVYRPAAVDQLKVLGEQIGVKVYAEPGNTDAVGIARQGIQHARANGYNVVIVDTAGRLAVDEAMMNEIAAIKEAIRPQETLFVVDSMTGQDAVNTAKAFNDRLNFDGVVLTKLDGDTRGGAALSIRQVVDKPIKFVSRGEKTDTLDVFHPDRMARRILGMGDIVSLVEKAQEQYDEEKARELQRKMRKNQFDFDDFLNQLAQVRKMGNIKDLLGMIPGVGKQLKDLDIDDSHFKRIESMIQSMTPQERANPDLINSNRRQRIARGSGRDIQEVNQFMKQFEDMRKMMKSMNKMGAAGKSMSALNAIKARR